MSLEISVTDFENICRICLKVSEEMVTINKYNIINMILECTNVKCWFKDDLPQNICSTCHLSIQNAFQLKQLIEQSDQKLRQLLDNEIGTNPLKKEYSDKIELNNHEYVKTELLSDHLTNDFDNGLSPISAEDIKSEHFTDEVFTPQLNDCLESTDGICTDRKSIYVDLKRSKAENFQCEVCNKIFLNRCKLKKHLVAHSNDRPYQCSMCSKAFKEKFILNKHLKTVHTDPTRRKDCSICGRSIVKTSLERHLKTHENPPSYQCLECTKKFLDSDTLQKHFRRVHKKETSFELYPYLCNQCGKGLISKSELKRHMHSHTKEPNFKCTRCGKAYTSNAGLRSHVKVFHLNERPFTCTICSRAFPTKIILKHHMRTHTGEKPFSCLICTKTFAIKCVLQTHMKVHK